MRKKLKKKNDLLLPSRNAHLIRQPRRNEKSRALVVSSRISHDISETNKRTKKPKASRETKRARTKRARAGDDGRRGATGAGGDDGRSGDGSVAKDIIAGSFVLSAFTQ